MRSHIHLNPSRWLLSVAFLAAITPVVADVLTPQIFLLEAGDVQDEDAYVAAASARIDGRIEGDLVIAAGAIDIGGVITGDVFVVSHARLAITGTVEGSVRGLAREVAISGVVGGDVAVVAGNLTVGGAVERDVLAFAGSISMTGSAGRDVKGRFLDGLVDGPVGRDVDVSVRTFRVGAGAVVGGDVLYRADSDANVSGGAQVTGQFQRLPSRATFIVRVWLIAVTILSFLAFIVSGFVLLGTFRTTTARATGLVRTATWKTMWVGLLAVIGIPLLSIVFLFTVVGAPVGLLLILLWLLGLVFAPVPAVAAAGDVLLRGRAGIFGAFVVGAVAWRVGIWLVPLVGVLLYTAALVAGTGGLVLAGLQQRRREAGSIPPLLPARREPPPPEIPDDWEPPLAPASPAPPPVPPGENSAPNADP